MRRRRCLHIGVTERADVRIYEAFGELSDGDVYVVARNVTNVVEPERLVVLVALLLGAAALQRRWRLALGTLVVVVGANLTTQVLKPLTAAERIPSYLADASWPSGHMTAMTSLALCLVVVAPRVLSAAAAGVAAVMVVAMAYSLLLIGTHHPSDVLAGMLVAGAWTAVLEFVLERATFSAGATVIALVTVALIAATSLAARAPRGLTADGP